MPAYRADHFRRIGRLETGANGIGRHDYNAADDVAAIKLGKAFCEPYFDPQMDRIHIEELRTGQGNRHVWLVGN